MLKTSVGVHRLLVIAAKEIQTAVPIIVQFSVYLIYFIIQYPVMNQLPGEVYVCVYSSCLCSTGKAALYNVLCVVDYL